MKSLEQSVSHYERNQKAQRCVIILDIASIVGAITAVLIFMGSGLSASLPVLLLSLVAFALARLLNTVADMMNTLERIEAKLSEKPEPAKEAVSS